MGDELATDAIPRGTEPARPSPGAAGDGSDSVQAEVAKLVALASKGDRDAFGKLYDLYLDRVYRYVYYRLSRTAEAEDLTEDIFLKVWEALPAYQQRGLPFAAWLFRLARNHVIDYTRTRHEAMPLLETVPESDVGPEAAALRRLRATELRQLLAQLTEEQREVIVLRFLEGLSTKEIAASMERQEGAIRALQMRALQALRALIGNGEL